MGHTRARPAGITFHPMPAAPEGIDPQCCKENSNTNLPVALAQDLLSRHTHETKTIIRQVNTIRLELLLKSAMRPIKNIVRAIIRLFHVRSSSLASNNNAYGQAPRFVTQSALPLARQQPAAQLPSADLWFSTCDS
jgi:hypothetical protein